MFSQGPMGQGPWIWMWPYLAEFGENLLYGRPAGGDIAGGNAGGHTITYTQIHH